MYNGYARFIIRIMLYWADFEINIKECKFTRYPSPAAVAHWIRAATLPELEFKVSSPCRLSAVANFCHYHVIGLVQLIYFNICYWSIFVNYPFCEYPLTTSELKSLVALVPNAQAISYWAVCFNITFIALCVTQC